MSIQTDIVKFINSVEGDATSVLLYVYDTEAPGYPSDPGMLIDIIELDENLGPHYIANYFGDHLRDTDRRHARYRSEVEVRGPTDYPHDDSERKAIFNIPNLAPQEAK